MAFIPYKTPVNGSTTVVVDQRNTENADNAVGLVKTDQAGNVLIDQSFDGANWDYTDTIAVAANTGTKISVAIVAPYIRLRFQNTSVTNQTFLRLYLRFTSAGYRG